MLRRFNVVFLDFDGVLNTAGFLHEWNARTNGLYRESDMIDPEKVALVNDLLKRAAPAAVVISSSWRMGRMRVEMCDILNARGFDGIVLGMTPVMDRTPDGMLYVRGHEIQKWLDTNKRFEVPSFVILDDDTDMAHLNPRLVNTNFTTGLLPQHVEKALQILKEPYVPEHPKSV